MKEHLTDLNQKLLNSLTTNYPIGLCQGQMGLVIYYYHLSIIYQEPKYKEIAEQLLDGALQKASVNHTVNLEKGLSGVALGIRYLINAGFVDGDINELLEEIDHVVFKNLAFGDINTKYTKPELLHLLLYLSFRVSDQTEANDRYIYEELIIKVINHFTNKLSADFFNEDYSFSVYNYHLPVFLWIFARLLSLNFYNDRIIKLLEEFQIPILSRVPLLHTNRLYVLCGALPLASHLKQTVWDDYIQFLQREIDFNHILEKEISNKKIFISNGLSMIYLMLYYIEKEYPDHKIPYSAQAIYERTESSEAWSSLLSQDYFFNIHSGLLNGFPGVELVMSHIKSRRI